MAHGHRLQAPCEPWKRWIAACRRRGRDGRAHGPHLRRARHRRQGGSALRSRQACVPRLNERLGRQRQCFLRRTAGRANRLHPKLSGSRQRRRRRGLKLRGMPLRHPSRPDAASPPTTGILRRSAVRRWRVRRVRLGPDQAGQPESGWQHVQLQLQLQDRRRWAAYRWPRERGRRR